jgi:hypothetical protein
MNPYEQTHPLETTEYQKVTRVNKSEIVNAVLVGIVVVVFPVAGFIGAMRAEEKYNYINKEEKEVLGISTDLNIQSSGNTSIKLPVVNTNISIPEYINYPQVITGFGIGLGIVALALAIYLIRGYSISKSSPNSPVTASPSPVNVPSSAKTEILH